VLVDAHESSGRGRSRRLVALGRSAFDAPEIDGVVRIDDGERCAPGSFVQVRITGAGEHDLAAVAAG